MAALFADIPPGDRADHRGCPMTGPQMSGPAHYREAEKRAEAAAELAEEGRQGNAQFRLHLAQVHATLTLAAATAYPAVRNYWGPEFDETSREWAGVAS